jgi:serine/threonine protein kinase
MSKKEQEKLADFQIARLSRKVKGLQSELDATNQHSDLWQNFLSELKPESRAIYAEVPAYLFKLYRLDRYLAKGGQGITFLVKDGMGRNALLKIGEYESLKNEYVALNSIKSPNIISLYLGEKFGNAMVLVEEFVSGVNLGQVITKAKDHQWLGSDTYHIFATMIFMQIITALESIHNSKGEYQADGKLEDLGFVHRDIKPDNIMLGYDGTTKLIDFGLARKVGITQAKQIKGFSLPFASPNQIRNKPHQIQDDYYSLTCLAIMLLEGGFERFYKNEDIQNILKGNAEEFITKQFKYFAPRLDKLLPIFQRVEQILKAKFVPRNFKDSIKNIQENPHLYGGEKNLKERLDQIQKYQAEANKFPLAEELYNALTSPFFNTSCDISHLVKGFQAHRFMHQEFMARQTYLLKSTQ